MFPRPRALAGLIVEEQDYLPDLALGEKVLPYRHGGNPRCRLLRQAGAAGGDAPEQVRLLDLGDGADVLEVERHRVEARGVGTPAVELAAVAGVAVLDINRGALGDERLELLRVLFLDLAVRVDELQQIITLAEDHDGRGRGRMD